MYIVFNIKDIVCIPFDMLAGYFRFHPYMCVKTALKVLNVLYVRILHLESFS